MLAVRFKFGSVPRPDKETGLVLNNWLSLLQFLLFASGGVCLIRFRVAISNFNVRTFRAMNSPLGEREARAARPGMMLALGVLLLCLAVGALEMGLFRRQW